MRRAAAALALAILAGACSNAADQGTVRACFETIGVAEPDVNGLGSVQGWVNVAERAATEAKDERVKTAGEALKAAVSPDVQLDGFTDAEKDRYIDAVKQMTKACRDAKAFEGDPRK